MSFTQASLQTALDTAVSGNNCIITQYMATSSANYTDVCVQNLNTSSKKSGWVQVAAGDTATQAAADILTALT